jgi:hypothetical protein
MQVTTMSDESKEKREHEHHHPHHHHPHKHPHHKEDEAAIHPAWYIVLGGVLIIVIIVSWMYAASF